MKAGHPWINNNNNKGCHEPKIMINPIPKRFFPSPQSEKKAGFWVFFKANELQN